MNSTHFASTFSRSLLAGSMSAACAAVLFATAVPGCVADTGELDDEAVGETQQAEVATAVTAIYTASVVAKNFSEAYRNIVGGGLTLPRSRGQHDYAAIAATAFFDPYSTGFL